MNPRTHFAILPLAMAAVVLAQAPAPKALSAGSSPRDLVLNVGKSLVLESPEDIQRVSVASGDILELVAVSPREVVINGKAAGESSLILWQAGGNRLMFDVSVRKPDLNLEALRRELAKELGEQSVTVSFENGAVFLRGTVKDLTSSARAVQIASTSGSKVVNLLNVEVPKFDDPQFLLKVRFVSVDRNKALSLGINLVNLGLGHALGGVSTGQFGQPSIGSTATASSAGLSGPTGSAQFSQEGNIFAFFPGLNVGADIYALETKNVAEVLAEPNLLASNGKEASFLAGGEFPYPVVSGSSGGTTAVTIEFKQYGIRLNFIPTLLPRGTIRLQVAPEVSALDYTHEVEISGFEVPGLTSRKVNTEVELKDGQTFIIGGLLDKGITDTFSKIPFLGDIPILGKLFQSETKTKNDTELIVLVTPEIVNPLPANAALPDLNYPDKKFIPPNSNIPMHQPDAKTADNTLPSPPAAIPVETLVDSMKPEKPLVIESGAGGFGIGGGAINGPASSAPSATGVTAP